MSSKLGLSKTFTPGGKVETDGCIEDEMTEDETTSDEEGEGVGVGVGVGVPVLITSAEDGVVELLGTSVEDGVAEVLTDEDVTSEEVGVGDAEPIDKTTLLTTAEEIIADEKDVDDVELL
jgi:hypothetical protein